MIAVIFIADTLESMQHLILLLGRYPLMHLTLFQLVCFAVLVSVSLASGCSSEKQALEGGQSTYIDHSDESRPSVSLSPRLSKNTILVVGDSLSAAYKMPIERGWVSLLTKELELACPEVSVLNASISGETTSGGIARLPALLAESQPQLVLLQLGANDGLQGKPVAAISANLQRMIDQIEEFGAETVLIGIRLPPNYGVRYTKPFFAQFATLAERNDLASVPFLLEPVATNNEYKQADGLHPNAAAQPLVLEHVKPYLETSLDQVFGCKLG